MTPRALAFPASAALLLALVSPALAQGKTTAYYADRFAVDGDSLKDVTLLEKIPFVMKGGEVVVPR